MERICVFCGSSTGSGQEYMQAARDLGIMLAKRKITVVYGGASVGLMGQVAKACLEAGGDVIGVITRKLYDMEVAYTQLAQLHVVESMHDRKAKMAELSDGFIALPGGLGTLEELFEVLTWSQLGMHNKPCGLLNTRRYYDQLLAFLDTTVDQQFVEGVHRNMLLVDESADGLLQKFETYQAPSSDKAAWVLHMTNQANGK